MNNQPPQSRRKRKEKNKENKRKEEEEIHPDGEFSVEVIPNKYGENLDFVVQGLKIKNSLIKR